MTYAHAHTHFVARVHGHHGHTYTHTRMWMWPQTHAHNGIGPHLEQPGGQRNKTLLAMIPFPPLPCGAHWVLEELPIYRQEAICPRDKAVNWDKVKGDLAINPLGAQSFTVMASGYGIKVFYGCSWLCFTLEYFAVRVRSGKRTQESRMQASLLHLTFVELSVMCEAGLGLWGGIKCRSCPQEHSRPRVDWIQAQKVRGAKWEAQWKVSAKEVSVWAVAGVKGTGD